MKTTRSKDGTTIAYDQVGSGPTLILVSGALQHRAFDEETTRLAMRLAPSFTTLNYDRRGRGDSGDTPPYAVAREIEDLEALIDATEGPACLYGLSSGAALVLEAAAVLGDRVAAIALYEPPFNDDPVARQEWTAFAEQLRALLADNRRGDAVRLFLTVLGTTAEELQVFSNAPVWPLFEAVAPTLAYDVAILGEESRVPLERASQVTTRALLMAGGAESPYKQAMQTAMAALASCMPQAQTRILEGQNHFVDADALAPVLTTFFLNSRSQEQI